MMLFYINRFNGKESPAMRNRLGPLKITHCGEGPGFGLPLKGDVLLKPYKLKVSIFGWPVNRLASCPVLNYGRTGMTGRRANLFNFSSLQTLATLLQAEPDNSDLAHRDCVVIKVYFLKKLK